MAFGHASAGRCRRRVSEIAIVGVRSKSQRMGEAGPVFSGEIPNWEYSPFPKNRLFAFNREEARSASV